MKKYTHIIFDLDGTLLDTLSDIINALNMALKEINVAYQYGYTEGRDLLGNGAIELARKVFRQQELPQSLFDPFLILFEKNYKLCQGALTKPYVGIPGLIQRLKEDGYHLAICSNKPDSIIHESVSKFFELSDFEFVLGQKEGYNPKPDPKSLLEEINKRKIDLSKVLYVGDSDVDILLAHNLKVDSCGCTYGYRSRKKLINTGATFLIDTPLQLLLYLC